MKYKAEDFIGKLYGTRRVAYFHRPANGKSPRILMVCDCGDRSWTCVNTLLHRGGTKGCSSCAATNTKFTNKMAVDALNALPP